MAHNIEESMEDVYARRIGACTHNNSHQQSQKADSFKVFLGIPTDMTVGISGFDEHGRTWFFNCPFTQEQIGNQLQPDTVWNPSPSGPHLFTIGRDTHLSANFLPANPEHEDIIVGFMDSSARALALSTSSSKLYTLYYMNREDSKLFLERTPPVSVPPDRMFRGFSPATNLVAYVVGGRPVMATNTVSGLLEEMLYLPYSTAKHHFGWDNVDFPKNAYITEF